MAVNLFGFEIKRKNEKENLNSFVEPQNEDSALDVMSTVPGGGGSITSVIDMQGSARNEAELVQRYRLMMQQPEVQKAVDDIVNEAINITEDTKPVTCITDGLKYPDSIKKKVREEFDNVLELLDFSNQGYDIFSKWYVDGRLNFHIIIDENNTKKGIQELRYIDPRKLRKIREFEQVKVGDGSNQSFVKKLKNEYYIYSDTNLNNAPGTGIQQYNFDGNIKGLRIAKDSIAHCNSGLFNEDNTMVLSYLDKAYKPMNQLRMMEDAAVVYRLSRAPERRVFYIDVGNLPKAKAEQYLREMMVRHKNRLVYDATTGDIRDDRRHMAMTDDFWLPRREGGKGTEITTLPGGQNLGEMEDILYFQRRLNESLHVPISRMQTETGFSLGRASEITRDEVKFSKFVRRLRVRFSILFDRILEKQLILKGVISPEDWPEIKNGIRYDFMMDNHFEELKQAEIIRERVQLLNDVDNYTGKYFSKEWARKNILKMSDEDIEQIKKEIETEAEEEPEEDVPNEQETQSS